MITTDQVIEAFDALDSEAVQSKSLQKELERRSGEDVSEVVDAIKSAITDSRLIMDNRTGSIRKI